MDKMLEDKLLIEKAANGEFNEQQKRIAEIGQDWVATLIRKNLDYGGSVFQAPILAPDLPVDSAIRVRMSDKIQRLMTLLAGNKNLVQDEGIEDTFKDLGAYCLLRAVAIKLEKESNGPV